MTVNYAEEAKLLSDGFWKPPVGETIVAAVTELSDKMELRYEGDDGESETQLKVDLAIEAEGKRHAWRVTVNHSQRSLYGQLVLLADRMGGLAGKLIKVTRRGSGRSTSYVVSEVTG